MRVVKFLIVIMFLSFAQRSNEERIGVWNVKNGQIQRKNSNKDKIAAQYWAYYKKIFPFKETNQYIKKMVLMTDGPDEKTGALASLSKNNDQWQLIIDITDVNFETNNKKKLYESVYTLVHEFGHLLTLNKTQITPTNKGLQDEGEPYLTDEGQAKKRSYLNKFVSLFWKDHMLGEWDTIQREHCHTEASCVEKLYDLYSDNHTEFVTDYAAESPEEDIVESWTAFVLRPKFKNPRTIAQKKVNFFYQFPELVRYRSIIKQKTRRYLH